MDFFKKILWVFISLSYISLVFSQEETESQESDSEESDDTSAESAITGSVASVQTAPSGAIESNPLVLLVRSGSVSLSDALSLGLAGCLELQSSLGNLDVSDDVFAAALAVRGLDFYDNSKHQTALTEAAILANNLLIDRSISSTADLPSPISVNSFNQDGYNVAFLYLLSKYGAIGSSGDSLVNTILGETLSDSLYENTSLLSKQSTSNYLSYLSTFTGGLTFGDTDSISSVLDLKIENLSATTGANITIGSPSVESSIDVSSILTKAADDHRDYRKAYSIVAAKDMEVSGKVTFVNANDAEDHAMILGAADDFMMKDSDLAYTGSNLGIGSGGTDTDSMYLVNSKITTGGNLAVATLGTLNISNSEFNVGNGGVSSDPDNIYLIANELIQVNSLNFSASRLDDVYMEAITVNLKDVAFPETADVILKSRDGTLHFDSYNSPTVGGVNLSNVSHGTTTLTSDHFDGGVAGHIDSTISLPNGKAAVKIRKQY